MSNETNGECQHLVSRHTDATLDICKLCELPRVVRPATKEGNANTHLIDATPDLLAALEGMLESLDLLTAKMKDGMVKDIVLSFFTNEAERAQAAIAKAKKLDSKNC